MSKPPRLLVTVADLRAALQDLPPHREIICVTPPYVGVILEDNGGKILIRSPRNGAESGEQ